MQETYRFENKLFTAVQSLPPPQSEVELMQRTTLDHRVMDQQPNDKEESIGIVTMGAHE